MRKITRTVSNYGTKVTYLSKDSKEIASLNIEKEVGKKEAKKEIEELMGFEVIIIETEKYVISETTYSMDLDKFIEYAETQNPDK